MLIILEEQTKTEVLAIRFANSENATKFKTAFDSAVMTVTETEAMKINLEEGTITTESKEEESHNESDSKDPKPAQSPKNKSDEILLYFENKESQKVTLGIVFTTCAAQTNNNCFSRLFFHSLSSCHVLTCRTSEHDLRFKVHSYNRDDENSYC